MKNFTPLTVPCDYELPEKLTMESVIASQQFKDFLKTNKVTGWHLKDELTPTMNIYSVNTKGSTNRRIMHVRLVLADYCCHIDIFSDTSPQRTAAHITLNEQVYTAWQADDISCVRKYYTHGEEIITTLDYGSYCRYVVNWEKSFNLTPTNFDLMPHCRHTLEPLIHENLKVGAQCTQCYEVFWEQLW